MHIRYFFRVRNWFVLSINLFFCIIVYFSLGKSATYNVKDFGAKGDGMTDDTDAIQKTVNKAYYEGGASTGTGGSVVYFPKGTYIVTSVKVRDNVAYEGESKEGSIIKRPAAPIVGTRPIEITRDNPAKLTFASKHDLRNGSVIFFSSITQAQWDSLNHNISTGAFIVRVVDDYSVRLYEYNGMQIPPAIYSMVKGTETYVSTLRRHNLVSGETITFFDIVKDGWKNLNNKSFEVIVVDSYTFKFDFNSSGFEDYNADEDPGIHYKNLNTSSFLVDYSSMNPTVVRLQYSSLRTFTVDSSVAYKGDNDSKPLVIKNLTFDGSSSSWGPYRNYQQEHAALIFLTANRTNSGRLNAIVNNCYFKNCVADAIGIYVNVDIKVKDCVAEECFRGGFVLTGGYSKAYVKNFVTRGVVNPTGIDIEVDAPGYGDSRAVDLLFEDIYLENGDCDIGAHSGSTVTCRNIISGANDDRATCYFYFQDAKAYFYNCILKINRVAIYFPKNVIFDGCTFIVTENISQEEDRVIHGFMNLNNTKWYVNENSILKFVRCKFLVDSNIEATDSVTAVVSDHDPIENNNKLIFEKCMISNDFDYGIRSYYRGGQWIIKDTLIEAQTALSWAGSLSYGLNCFVNVKLDGVVSKSTTYMSIWGNNLSNEIEHQNIQIEESYNKIHGGYTDITSNTFTGFRVILGEKPPTSNTHGFVGDIYCLKKPVSGEVHQWRCIDMGYNSNPSSWVALPIVSVIASIEQYPSNPNYCSTATFRVGGKDVTHFKYKLDNGLWSEEYPVSKEIKLKYLGSGTHKLYVIGKGSGGIWQPEDRATTYQWLVLLVDENRSDLYDYEFSTSTIDNIIVYPQPFNLKNAKYNCLKFINIPLNSRVKIFNLVGDLITEIEEQSGRIFWDGMDKDGKEVAVGVYYYILNMPDGKRKRGKIVLVK